MTAVNPIVVFLDGAVSMACVVAGLLFLSYWRDSRDRLFVFFAVAFWVLGLNWAALGVLTPVVEQRHWLHAIRLVAFLLIGLGIVDKNRREGR
jgi:hypothetical protein